MKLGDLFKNIATKAGVNVNEMATKDANFASLLAVAVEVPDDVAGQIETSLLPMAAAKNNGELKGHFFAQALDGVDRVQEKVAKKLGISDDVWQGLAGEKSTMKRLEMLADKISELHTAKIQALDKGDKAQFQQQIDALQNEMKIAKESHATELARLNSDFDVKETGLLINAMLAGKNFANKDVPSDVNILTARALLDQALSREGAKVVKHQGVIKLLKQDDTDYFDRSHNKVDVGSFLDNVLSTNKMLVVTDPNAGSGDNKTQQQQTTVQGNGGAKINQTLLNRNSQALQSLAAAGTGV